MPQTLRLEIDGMHCPACVRRVQSALEGLLSGNPNVRLIEVSIGSARLEYQQSLPEVDFAGTLSRIGFSLQKIETS